MGDDVPADRPRERQRTISRRRAIQMGLLTMGAAGLAGCSGAADDGGTETATDTRTASATPTETATATPTATETATTTTPEFDTLAIQRGSIDVTDLSSLGAPTVPLEDFDAWLGDTGEGDIWLRWDEEQFYFAAAVQNSHFEKFIGTEKIVWDNDAFQVGMAPGAPTGASNFVELNFGDTFEGPILWHVMQPSDEASRSVTDIDMRVEHFPDDGEGRTEFAYAIPWSELGHEFDPAPGTRLSLTIAQHDRQAERGEHWRTYGGGMLGVKEPASLGTAEFTE
ncbi:hypothetical protein [Haloarchaeobius sp. HME9146]|uniref:hypothetical protein n=1 Tax=Haloarchaeobius sp. HME9146 TaxID=2978732 RepID=UPI0021C22B3F|nr:hypothetical protein [Haloarchaeobius sp. HME9146]MCT9098052.1 hypothetical protein [Haloarchaeobius sp. HME9146]